MKERANGCSISTSASAGGGLICTLVVLLCLALSACKTFSKKDSSQTRIEGNIESSVAGEIYLYGYKDSVGKYLGQREIIDSGIVEKNGDYFILTKCNHADLYDLRIGSNVLIPNLFLSPGSLINLNFKGSKRQPVFSTKETEGKYNDYLLSFIEKFYQEPEVKQQYYINTNYMDVARFDSYVHERRKQQLDFFENYFRNETISKDFQDFATSEIKYQYAVDKLMYLWKKRMKSEKIKVDSSYYDFTDTKFLQNNEAVNSPAYIRFLNLYIKNIYELLLEGGKIPADKTKKLDPLTEKYNLALQYLSGTAFNIVACNIRKDQMNETITK